MSVAFLPLLIFIPQVCSEFPNSSKLSCGQIDNVFSSSLRTAVRRAINFIMGKTKKEEGLAGILSLSLSDSDYSVSLQK